MGGRSKKPRSKRAPRRTSPASPLALSASDESTSRVAKVRKARPASASAAPAGKPAAELAPVERPRLRRDETGKAVLTSPGAMPSPPPAHRRSTSPLFTYAASALALVAAAGFIYAYHPFTSVSTNLPRSSSPASSPAATSGQQFGETRPITNASVLTPPATYTYPEDPPASGPHYPSTYAPAWGMQDASFTPEYYLSNLDRGGIVILYDCNAPSSSPSSCDAELAQVSDFVNGAPVETRFHEVKLAVFPYSLLAHRYVLLAWGWRLDMDQWDPNAALAFYGAHVDNGPTAQP